MAEEFKKGTVDKDGVTEEKTAFETGIRESQRERIPTLKGERIPTSAITMRLFNCIQSMAKTSEYSRSRSGRFSRCVCVTT
ncbi:Hypothetical predicted protein [Paramuricea clavata]|uniref:Uncharacterized protein n=1 Tax=Paramuricea clavata TaxID=317549 RepID=A0A6S7IN31_PARCT|nr:Hypothetical predicted protein [Paramuricea clavata]